MKNLLPALTEGFDIFINYAILVIEIVSVGILLYAVCRALFELFTKKSTLRLHLAEGIALALEFKLCSELLYTIVAREIEELFVVGFVVLLRAALTFLIHWEIKMETKHGEKTPEIESKTSDNSEKD